MRWQKPAGAQIHGGPPQELLSQDFDEWVLVGGDGTLQWAIEALAQAEWRDRRPPLLSLLPWGTGSDYSRSLPRNGSELPVDVGRIQVDDSKTHHFINVSSVGFSARVARAKEEQRGVQRVLPRSLAYLFPTLLELPAARPIQMALTSPQLQSNREICGPCWAVFVCKGQWAGGGMHFATDVQLSDGFFEVIWVESMSALKLLQKLPQVYQGGLAPQPGIQKFRLSELTLTSSEAPFEWDIDGETFQGSRLQYSLLPSKVTGLRIRLWLGQSS